MLNDYEILYAGCIWHRRDLSDLKQAYAIDYYFSLECDSNYQI
jgi:hypothetical protein